MVLFSPPIYPVDLKKHKSGPNGWKFQSSSRFGLGDYVCIVMIAYSNGKRKENTIILQKIHNLIGLQYAEGRAAALSGRRYFVGGVSGHAGLVCCGRFWREQAPALRCPLSTIHCQLSAVHRTPLPISLCLYR